MSQDFRFAFRSLLRARGFTVAAVLTLALGMGANTVVYSIVDALLFRPLPFGDRSGRLVTLHSTHPTLAQDWDDSDMSYPDLLDLREASRTLAGLEGVLFRNLSLSASTETERVSAASVTPGLFGLLGIEPRLGRGFTPDEGAEPGFESVLLISDRLWKRLFAGDPGIVGRQVPVNGRAVTVIGVMPPGFAFPEQQDVWLPFRADLNGLAEALAGRYPDTNRAWGVHVMRLRDLFVSDATRRGMTAMLLGVALVLLVACANVASLLVARGIGRQRELAVRTALGASRGRVVRLLVAESFVLTILAALAGLLLASWGLDGLLSSMPEPPPYWARIRIDARVLGYTFVLALITTAVCGLLPAIRASRGPASGGTLYSGRSGSTPEQRRLQGALVAGQVALSFALLVGATLLARSAMALQHADVGFDPAPLLSLRFYIAGDAYDDPGARGEVVARLVERLGSNPGVARAAATGAIPSDDGGDAIRLVIERPTGAPDDEIGAQLVPITPEFFETLGLELLDGRTFTAAEASRPDSDAIIVNTRLAAQFWPGDRAVDRRLTMVTASGTASYRIVGVAPDVVYEEPGEETPQSQLTVYVPYARAGWRTMALMVRAGRDPGPLASAARRTVREIDPAFAAYDVHTMLDRRALTSWGERFLGQTCAAFAIAALLLACIGAYGLTAYAAAQRRREIGVRLAIGAQRSDIVGLLLWRGVRLALIGSAVGLPLAIVAARLVEGLLFRVSPWDPAVWLPLFAALLAAVAGASFIPAHRASLTDPAVALREE